MNIFKFPFKGYANSDKFEVRDEAIYLSDWLAIVREVARNGDDVTAATKTELSEQLALAEAVLRRAHSETTRK